MAIEAILPAAFVRDRGIQRLPCWRHGLFQRHTFLQPMTARSNNRSCLADAVHFGLPPTQPRSDPPIETFQAPVSVLL